MVGNFQVLAHNDMPKAESLNGASWKKLSGTIEGVTPSRPLAGGGLDRLADS